MEILYAIAKLRNPVFDWIFETVTHLGEETLFLVIAIAIFWCIDKKEGYYVLVSGFFGICINQIAKITFRIDRPWVKDPTFQPVGDSKIEAGGYSFPSGHTQNIATTWGVIASYNSKRRWVTVLSVVIIVLVAFSRLYLGVHTLLDVSVSLLVALALVVLLRPVFCDGERFRRVMPFISGAALLLSVGFLVYVLCISGDTTLDPENYASAMKNACTMLGCTIGLVVVYTIDTRWIKFETAATWYAQIIKLAVGFGVVILIKAGLSAPLTALFGNEYVARVVRYFLMVAFGGVLWPMTFKWFSELKIEALDRFGEKTVAFIKGLFTKKNSEKAEK